MDASIEFLLDAAGIGWWHLDLATNTTTRSLLHDQVLGYTEMLPSWGFDDYIAHVHPDDRAMVTQSFAAAQAGGAPYAVDVRVLWPDGSIHWLFTRGQFLLDDQGTPVRVAGIVTDITDRKLVEMAASELMATRAADLESALARASASEDRYRALVERAGDAVLVADDEGRYVDANPAASVLLGVPVEEIVGRSLTDFVEDVAHLGDGRTAWAAFLAAGEMRGDVRLRQPGGVVRDAEFTATAHVTPGHHLSILRDVTERRVAQDALRRSEERFRSMLQDVPALAVITGRDGTVWFVNDALLSATGYDRDEVLGQVATDLFTAPEDRDAENTALERAFTSNAITPVWENEILTRDGEHRLVRWTSAFLYDQGEVVGLASIGQDTTDQWLLEEQLRQSQRLETVGQFTGGVAHDFNNLLTVIMGNSELLVDALEDQPAARKLASMTLQAAELGAELTRTLLAFARRQALAPRSVDVDRLVAELDSLLRRTLGEHVELGLVRASGLWPAHIDPSQFEVAVLNLAINARDAMPGGGRLTIETANSELDAEYAALNPEVVPGEYVLVAVSDTGTGIGPENLARVFEPFFTTKEHGTGTGLGLSMVYGFLKQSGGHVKIYSEQGHGTTVRMYLPRSTVPTDDSEQVRDVHVNGNETVLLVEDDEQVRKFAEHLLTALGYRIVTAVNGPTALAILRAREDIDLLFTDVVMPGGMSGRQLADAALQERPGLRVLYTSGYTENAMIHHGRLDPGVRLLSKPYKRADLARALREALDD